MWQRRVQINVYTVLWSSGEISTENWRLGCIHSKWNWENVQWLTRILTSMQKLMANHVRYIFIWWVKCLYMYEKEILYQIMDKYKVHVPIPFLYFCTTGVELRYDGGWVVSFQNTSKILCQWSLSGLKSISIKESLFPTKGFS